MTWHPVTQPPSEVGPYEIHDVFGHTHQVQWDGRHFRYAAGTFAGRVFAHYKGDLWRLPDRKEADGCTEENCRRCRTPRELRTPDMYHAGIGSYPSQPQEPR